MRLKQDSPSTSPNYEPAQHCQRKACPLRLRLAVCSVAPPRSHAICTKSSCVNAKNRKRPADLTAHELSLPVTEKTFGARVSTISSNAHTHRGLLRGLLRRTSFNSATSSCGIVASLQSLRDPGRKTTKPRKRVKVISYSSPLDEAAGVTFSSVLKKSPSNVRVVKNQFWQYNQ